MPLRIAVVVPCYRVREKILSVLARIGPEVSSIYVVDDCCPENTGDLVTEVCKDTRVCIIQNGRNLGVGGTVIAGYSRALAEGAEVIVKIDGDGQMDPTLIPSFAAPIAAGEADYTKGNRFFDPESLAGMPSVRLLGNAILSLMSKLSTGYWTIFDPANGYTAIHARVAERIPFEKVSKRYFFETDMLFRLSALGAVVVDVPMAAVYSDEQSSLRLSNVIPEFFFKHLRNTGKRLLYRYFIRDVSIASVELVAGLILIAFGSTYGALRWYESAIENEPATAGAVMLAALPFLAGLQLLIAFLNYDIMSVPSRAISPALTVRLHAQQNISSPTEQADGGPLRTNHVQR